MSFFNKKMSNPLFHSSGTFCCRRIPLTEEYDAVEVIGDIVWKLRFGSGGNISEKYFLIKSMGLYSWDVPSICVMNPEKVVVL